LKHRNMLIAAIITCGLGVLLGFVLAPILVFYGIGSYTTGWWPFQQTIYYTTPLYWVGVAFHISGLILVGMALVLCVITIVLEVTGGGNVERERKAAGST